MTLYHHTGDIVSSPFSPVNAFFFTKLMIWAGWMAAPAAAAPGGKSKTITVRVWLPTAIFPAIDAACKADGVSREEFILNAVQEKMDCGATVKTVWVSLPDCWIAAMDSVCKNNGWSRQELFERIIREQLPAIERGAGQGPAAAVKGGAR
jgi:metal-responsive CopG/Arc/MetJ family transcriptional regulator